MTYGIAEDMLDMIGSATRGAITLRRRAGRDPAREGGPMSTRQSKARGETRRSRPRW